MQDRRAQLMFLTTALLALSGCGRQQAGPEPDATTAAEPAPPAAQQEVAALPRMPSAAGARAFFITPADGETVSSPVIIEFGIEGMQVVKAGDDTPYSGHHHLLIDTGLPDLGQPIAADAKHVHFGDGSTTTELSLDPGEHTLQLLLGDHRHLPHDPPVLSEIITVSVE